MKGKKVALTPLLPERHPTRDFFIADIFDNLPVKDDVASMEHPFFTLSTKPDNRVLEYANGDKTIKIMPSHIGLPTIFDKDVLLYCASHVMDHLNKGDTPPKTLRISIHDFLIATNRNTSGDAYERFKGSLVRLASSLVETTIQTGATKQVRGFGLIESYEYLESHRVKDRFIGLEITLSDWFYNSLIAKEVLTIDRDYFSLRKPIERQVYEIARKHCGEKSQWSISLKKLYEKSGALSASKHFRSAVRSLVENDHLPEYRISFDAETDIVTFTYRAATIVDSTDKEEQGDLFGGSSLQDSIQPDLLEDVKQVVGVGLDYHQLWHEFRQWKGSKNAKNPRGAFIGFCQKKAASAMRI